MSTFIMILHGQHIQRKQVDNCLKFYDLTKNIYIICATCIFVNICCCLFAQFRHLYDVYDIFFNTLTNCKTILDAILIIILNTAINLSFMQYLIKKVFLFLYV